MKTFMSLSDLDQLAEDYPARPVIKQLLEWLIAPGEFPEDQRLYITEKLFGVHFPLQLEPVIYGITERMAEDYNGGYWDFYTLSNGGFFMGLSEDRIFHVKCQNMCEGDLSADALGITSCLYAYSHLSFTEGNIAREYARHHHRLREFMAEHPEVREILGATD